MSILWLGLTGLCVLNMAIVCSVSARSPRCALCRIAAEPVSEALLHSYPMVIEMAYRCPHCGQVCGAPSSAIWRGDGLRPPPSRMIRTLMDPFWILSATLAAILGSLVLHVGRVPRSGHPHGCLLCWTRRRRKPIAAFLVTPGEPRDRPDSRSCHSRGPRRPMGNARLEGKSGARGGARRGCGPDPARCPSTRRSRPKRRGVAAPLLVHREEWGSKGQS
jgi:hypothetical protein